MIHKLKIKDSIALSAMIVILCFTQAAYAQSKIASSHSIKVFMSSFNRNLASISIKLASISDELSLNKRDQELEHVLILSELLLINTTINYENKLNQNHHFIRKDMQARYFKTRLQDLINSKEKLTLSLGRLKRHKAGLLQSVNLQRKDLDVKSALLLNDLQHTVEKALVLFDMSIHYLQSVNEP